MTTLVAETDSIILIDPTLFDPNPYQRKRATSPEEDARLAEDVKSRGFIQNPVARIHPTASGRYQLAVGHRRRQAWLRGRPGELMPVIVKPLSDQEMYQYLVLENDDRADLSAIEKAELIQQYIKLFKVTQSVAAADFGLSQAAASNLLRLLQLPAAIQAHVHTGELAERHARALVSLKKFGEKEVTRITESVLSEHERDRDDALAAEVSDLLSKKGRVLDNDLWDPLWPAEPIVLANGDIPKDEPGLTQLLACLGCEFRFRHGEHDRCARPACFDLKFERALQQKVADLSAELQIPVATATERTIIYDGGYDNDRQNAARRLLKGKPPELRLALVANPKPNTHRFSLEEVTGSSYIMLTATDEWAIKRWLGANKPAEPRRKDKGAPAAADETEAQKAARIKREEAEREDGRKVRAKQNRAAADIVWLIESASEWAGKQIAASGGALEFLADEVSAHYYANTLVESTDLKTFRNQLDAKVKAAKAKELESLLRRRIAFDVFIKAVCQYHQHAMHEWPRAQHQVEEAVAKTLRGKLPKDWNKPPIHKTETNCWTCGRFGSNPERITKGELEQGWQVQLKGKEVAGVYCPDHAISAK